MVRRIIEIDQEKCNGCGACAAACHEGAIGMVDGKAVLLRDDYCDGLGDCLPTCPTGAITFVEREAAAYDEAAVLAKKAEALKGTAPRQTPPSGGCPGSMAQALRPAVAQAVSAPQDGAVSHLAQWPVQIKLVPVEAPWFNGARLLIAADCTAYARADFHQRFMRGRITLIGCPKLDEGDYAEKLTEILRRNDIRELTIVRMDVPCCGGMQRAAETALRQSGKFIPWQGVTLGRDGNILKTQNPAISGLERSRCRSSQEITDSPTPFSALNCEENHRPFGADSPEGSPVFSAAPYRPPECSQWPGPPGYSDNPHVRRSTAHTRRFSPAPPQTPLLCDKWAGAVRC